VYQGIYKSSNIAVLTLYTGQLQKLQTKICSNFEIVLSKQDEDLLAKEGFINKGVVPESKHSVNQLVSSRKPLERKKLSDLLRLSTADNFQGKEAKIIIISLVQSNKAKKVGFLKTTNCINILLSRA
jgi:superfamily I DNA and/or RNA helicase